MNLADIKALVAVVETGSLARAAVKLGLTQPAVTRRIQRLEDALEVRLLDRDMKPARVTAEGRTAYAECIRVMRAADDLKGAFGKSETERPLRLGVSSGAADLILATLLAVPDAAATISFAIHSSPTIERGVAEGRFDLGLVLRHSGDGASDGERIATLPAAIIAPRDEAIPRPTTLKALRGKRWVLCPGGCGFRRALEHRLYGEAQPLDIAVALWGFERQVELVAAGVGIGLVPLKLLELSPYAKKIKVVPVSDFSAALDLTLLSSMGGADARFEPFRRSIMQVLAPDGAKAAKPSRRRRETVS